jgi:hypothetical protein
MAKKYDKIYVVFKFINRPLYDWVVRRSQEEDMSMSAFIIRSLKLAKKIEESSK